MVKLVPSDVMLIAPYIFLYTSGTVAELLPPLVFPVVVPVASFLQEALIKIREEKMIIYFIRVIYGLVEVVVEIYDHLVADPFGHLEVVDHGDLLGAAVPYDHRVVVAPHDHLVVVHHEKGAHGPKADLLRHLGAF